MPDSTEELGGIKEEGELPERSEGEVGRFATCRSAKRTKIDGEGEKQADGLR